jgi:hypothetical protein
MGVIIFCFVSVLLIWALAVMVVSKFFRALAVAGVGAMLLSIASRSDRPTWLTFVGCSLLAVPIVTTFRKTIFGERG